MSCELVVAKWIFWIMRHIKEGYEAYAANHVICIGYRKQDSIITEVTDYRTYQNELWNDLAKLEKLTASKHCCIFSLHRKVSTIEGWIQTSLYNWSILNPSQTIKTFPIQMWNEHTKPRKTMPWSPKRFKDLCCVTQAFVVGLPCSVSDTPTEKEMLFMSFNISSIN